MAYMCNICDRQFTTPFNMQRHKRLIHTAEPTSKKPRDIFDTVVSDNGFKDQNENDQESEESDNEDKNESDDSTASTQHGGENEEDHEAWQFLLDCIEEKDLDYLLVARKHRDELIQAGVTEKSARERGSALFLKLMAGELRDCLLSNIQCMGALRKDTVYKELMEDVHDSDQPLKAAFLEAWKKHKNTIVSEIILPNFPKASTKRRAEDAVESDAETDSASQSLD
jgi:hypothetical protein